MDWNTQLSMFLLTRGHMWTNVQSTHSYISRVSVFKVLLEDGHCLLPEVLDGQVGRRWRDSVSLLQLLHGADGGERESIIEKHKGENTWN